MKILEAFEIPLLGELDENELLKGWDLIVDSMLGFGFKGELRSPFSEIIAILSRSSTPIFSVDVPSGWKIDGEKVDDEVGDMKARLNPAALVSLTLPKLCVKNFDGVHYIAGRFIPQ